MSIIPNMIYTIGHSIHSIERFIELLKTHGITAIADVRSAPYSQFNPQFNRETLIEDLKNASIQYVFLGKELGARSDDPVCYRNHKVQYGLLAGTDLFKQGLDRVKAGAEKFQIALMCAEKDPLECHRTILVARNLVEQGVSVNHILADGQIESHEEAMERLLALLTLASPDMFRSKEQAIHDAYERQGEAIAYSLKEENESDEDPGRKRAAGQAV